MEGIRDIINDIEVPGRFTFFSPGDLDIDRTGSLLRQFVSSLGSEYVPALHEINRLVDTQARSYGEAEDKLLRILQAVDVIRTRLDNPSLGDANFGGVDGLTERLGILVYEYNRVIRVAEQFRQEQLQADQERVQVQVDPQDVVRERLSREIESLNTSLPPVNLNLQFETPDIPEPQSLFDAEETEREVDRATILLRNYLSTLSGTSDLQRELQRSRLDLSLVNGDVTIEEFQRLRIEMEAVQALQSQGLPIDESTENVLKQRINLMTEIQQIQDRINASQTNTNDLLETARFATRRFTDGMADVAFQSRDVRDLVTGIVVELGKAAFRTALLNPFSNFLGSFVTGGQAPIRRQFGGTLLTGRNAYVFNEAGAERLTATRVISNNQTLNSLQNNRPEVNIVVNAVDVAGVEQAIERAVPRIVEMSAEFGRSLSEEQRYREDI